MNAQAVAIGQSREKALEYGHAESVATPLQVEHTSQPQS